MSENFQFRTSYIVRIHYRANYFLLIFFNKKNITKTLCQHLEGYVAHTNQIAAFGYVSRNNHITAFGYLASITAFIPHQIITYSDRNVQIH